jgi:hypothetical protein
MADIVVTFPKIPKNEKRHVPHINHYKRNINGLDHFVFKIGNSIPNKAGQGDRCYIGFDNKIQGFFIIAEIRTVDSSEAKEFLDWDSSTGNFVFCDFDSFKEYPNPKPIYHKGWPGFWYWADFLNRKP